MTDETTRWIDAPDAPPGSADLVRSLEGPPPLPPEVRRRARSQLRRRTGRSRRWLGPAILAAALTAGGALVWYVLPSSPGPGRLEAADTSATAPRRPASEPGQRVGAPASVDAGQMGHLRINTLPWTRVYVDGRDTGETTPVLDLAVPAGRHTLELRSDDGRELTLSVDVPAGETVTVMRRLDEPESDDAARAPQAPPEEGTTKEAADGGAEADGNERVRRCLMEGDQRCVVRALEGRADTARELAMLVEAYRQLGNRPAARRTMRIFLLRYPEDMRAERYKRVLRDP